MLHKINWDGEPSHGRIRGNLFQTVERATVNTWCGVITMNFVQNFALNYIAMSESLINSNIKLFSHRSCIDILQINIK